MIEKQLKVNDHIFDASGNIYVVDAVNKASYRVKEIDGRYGSENVPFNGMQRYGLSYVREFFVCDDAQRKVIENLNKRIEAQTRAYSALRDSHEKAKTLLDNLEFLREVRLRDLAYRAGPGPIDPDDCDDYWEDEDA